MTRRKSKKLDQQKSREKAQAITKTPQNSVFYYLTLGGLVVLLSYPPYFRGLFFQPEQEWTLLLGAIVFLFCWLWKLSRRDRLLIGPLEWSVLGLFVLYVISCFFAADLRLAVGEVVKWALYLIVFWTVSQVAAKERAKTVVLGTLYISGVGVALAGFMSAVGTININASFTGSRFCSTLQYPNTLAIYLAVVLMLGFIFWLQSGAMLRYLLTVSNFLVMFVFIGTGSRGGYVVLPLMLLLFLIGLPKEDRVRWLGHLLLILVAGAAASARIIPAAVDGRTEFAWIWFFLCVGWCVAGQLLGSITFEIVSKVKPPAVFRNHKYVTIGAAVILVVLLGSGLWVAGTGATTASTGGEQWYTNFLPQQVLARIADISPNAHSAQTRIYWTMEALDLIRESPVIGFGGGGWQAAYRAFQDYYYNTTQVHNQFLQIWVEAGTLGFAAYLALWFLFLFYCWRGYRSAATKNERVTILGLAVGGLGLGMHSAIDFDLSLGAISILLWSIIAVVRASYISTGTPAASQAPKGKRMIGLTIAGSLLTLVFVLLPTTLLVGDHYSQVALASGQAGKWEDAEAQYVKASRFDPFSGYFQERVARVQRALDKNESAQEYINAAILRSKYNYSYWNEKSVIEGKLGEWPQSVETAEKALRLAPWEMPAFEDYASACSLAGQEQLKAGDTEGARETLGKCAAIPARVQQQIQSMPPKAAELWGGEKKFLKLNGNIWLEVGKSNCLLGNFEAATQALEKAGKNNNDEANLWLALVAHRQGLAQESENYLNKISNDDLKQTFEELIQLPVIEQE